MGNRAGVRRGFVKLEQRRREGAELLRQGVHPAEVARRVGVHRQSVGRWAKQLEQFGLRAGRAGRKAQLGAEEIRRIERGLKRGPEALGYESGLWTSARVAHLIESECGVRYHPGHAWRILRQLGWSCQRPTGRARVGNRRAGQRLKKARKEGRTIAIVWDGLRSHRSRLVWEFVRQQRGRLWLEFLPAYAPELNPVEYLWAHWKQHELPNFCPESYGELSYTPVGRCAGCGVGRRWSLPSGNRQSCSHCNYIM